MTGREIHRHTTTDLDDYKEEFRLKIALIAHDAKKELMVQFCIAYCGVLSRHTLCGTGTTGKMVSEATGLQIQRF